ncbi:MAG: glycosyltransferase family 2 protein [Legionella sp.]|nr:glycosyltransferase family 2 protein [Legionella sp.]
MINFSTITDNWPRNFLLILLLFPLVGKAQFLSLSFVGDSFYTETSNLNQPTFSLPDNAKSLIQQNLSPSSSKSPQSTPKTLGYAIIYAIFLGMALSGFIPVITFFIEHNLSGLHAFCNHLRKCKDYCPRVAIIIPAWNEALVLEHTIDILLKMDYPLPSLRIYIIDDGSTDNTQELLNVIQETYPENVFHIYKDSGGKGKAYAVNYGLRAVLAEPWAEAILLIDADISFKKDALRLMARHLADPAVGAVTAYIKVGNRNTNYITRSIGYEYIVSQSVARRAQNVLGVVACLAGGAQLHSRANIEALGGEINTSTLAEDTYTTFVTQKMGKRVIYEGNAFVYAEEPKTILDVWKQRFRWGRGNLQITKAFKDVWFRDKSSSLGNLLFGIIWFSVILTPIVMIFSAVGLVGLFILNKQHSVHIFFSLVSVSFFVYLYTTLLAILVDKRTSRLSWLEGIFYPGLISIIILLISLNPVFFFNLLNYFFNLEETTTLNNWLLLFMETWSALCMFWAWIVFRLEYIGLPPAVSNFLLFIVGYGPLLCAINLAAYIAEIKNPNLKWDKTEKISTKRVIYSHTKPTRPYNFENHLYRDKRREYRFLCQQVLSLLIVSGFFLLIFSF